MFDVLIIGGGASGVSCALVLGSAEKKDFAQGKRIGILTHQRGSALQTGIYNNVYGIKPNTLGADLLRESLEHLTALYPHIQQIPDERVTALTSENNIFYITTNKAVYTAKIVVVAIGAGSPMTIEGLEHYVIPHQKALPEKNRIQLKNHDHKVTDGLYVAGTLAGHRSQLSIASGSGASVAGDILTLWNNGRHAQVHDAHQP